MLRASRHIVAASALAAIALAGCVGPPPGVTSTPGYRYFAHPAADDPWSSKINGWQGREQGLARREGPRALASVSGSGETARAEPAREGGLRAKYLGFRAERRRAAARELAAWIQDQAKLHYRPDGAIDHWATLEETLATDGDDCDGLELLVYYLLRDLGFGDEVYRAIVFRPEDGQHHMVTLWFEDPDDPWVIDPTGAMTSGMPHMSEVAGWVPLKVFTPTREFTVQEVAAPPLHVARP